MFLQRSQIEIKKIDLGRTMRGIKTGYKIFIPLFLMNSLILLIIFIYQACSQSYSVDIKSLHLPEECNQGLCHTGKINPDTEQVRPPTKVLLVVDNSRSMQLSQDYLAKGIQGMADGLRGFDANFYLYSTTDVHQNKIDINGQVRISDDKPVLNSTRLQVCKWGEMIDGRWESKEGYPCPNNQPTTYLLESLNFVNPSIIADVRFRSSDDESKLNEMSLKLAEGIRSVGIDGSTNETGICSLLRSIYNENENSIFKKGDNAAMVILSDEDDHSMPSNCFSRTTQEENFSGKPGVYQACNPLTEKCDQVDYKLNFSPITENVPYSEVKMNYKCETLTNSCSLNNDCENVSYKVSSLRQKISVNCEEGVSYDVSFSPQTIYSKNLTFQCDVYEDGVKIGISNEATLALQDTETVCNDGEVVLCDSNSLILASSKCTGNLKLNSSTCKKSCKIESKSVPNVVYKDNDPLASDRDLANSNTNLVLDWAHQNYPKYIVNKIIRGDILSGKDQYSWLNKFCSTENTVGLNCELNSEEYNKAKSMCGTKKVSSCKAICAADNVQSITIQNPQSDDVVNFCNNSDNNFKFTPTDSANSFKNIIEFLETKPFSNLSEITIKSCNRVGESFTSVEQSALVDTKLKEKCDGNYSNLFDLSTLCKKTSPMQNGISIGSISYSCIEKDKTIEKQPALSYTFTDSNSVRGQNLCLSQIVIEGVSYDSLFSYSMIKLNRPDQPTSCNIDSGKKLISSGVTSISKTNINWTFPTNVKSTDPVVKLEDSFHNKASELFGENGYFVSAIIRDEIEDTNELNCNPLGADQSYGVKYRNLVEATSKKSSDGSIKGDITSICALDYSKSLSSVTKWIKETTRRSYFINESTSEGKIIKVSLVKSLTGEVKELILGVDYEVVGNKINFINFDIDPKGWIIEYVYWMPKK